MLVAAGQPYEVGRTIRDAAGEPVATTQPTAIAYRPVDGLLAGGTLLLGAGSAQATQCVVRPAGTTGTWAARVPGALLSSLGDLVIEWTWTWEGDTYTGRDPLKVTTVPVCTLDDLASLPGESSRVVPGPARLRAIGVATEQLEEATRETYSPRLAVVDLWPGDLIDVPHPTEIRAAVQNDIALDTSTAKVDPVSGAWAVPGATAGAPIRMAVVHGTPTPPSGATRCVALLASATMADGPFDDRGVAVGGDGGIVRLLTAGVARAMFSIPEVEAFARRRRVPTIA